jgi:hypothetical protein
MPVELTVQSLFEASESALAAGDEAGAMNHLKKARELSPENPEVASRIKALQRRIKAENLVQITRRKIAEGSMAEALAGAREAFSLWPQVPGLEELVAALEGSQSPGSERKGAARQQAAPRTATAKPSTAARPVQQAPERKGSEQSADDYVQRVREQIQMSAFPTAAQIAAEGLKRFPGHELLTTFVEKFSRMGLLPK